jgi:putative acetyltransferase
MIAIRAGGLDDDRVVALLRTHVDLCRAVTPPGSSHALDLDGLRQRHVHFLSAWVGDTPVGTGAWKALPPGPDGGAAGEIKSMFTAPDARGAGVARAVLAALVASARVAGIARLYLETGSFDYFAPARALYLADGFVECGPFPPYRPDPNSSFFTRAI